MAETQKKNIRDVAQDGKDENYTKCFWPLEDSSKMIGKYCLTLILVLGFYPQYSILKEGLMYCRCIKLYL